MRTDGENVESAEALYAELKPDIGALATQLFKLSETILRKSGNFLPHAMVLTTDGEIIQVGATTGNYRANSVEILPILHEGLRQQAKKFDLKAIGVAGNVTITLEGQQPTKAIKVLVEHKRGLAVALYLPFKKKLFRRYVMGSTFSRLAPSGINAWSAEAI